MKNHESHTQENQPMHTAAPQHSDDADALPAAHGSLHPECQKLPRYLPQMQLVMACMSMPRAV